MTIQGEEKVKNEAKLRSELASAKEKEAKALADLETLVEVFHACDPIILLNWHAGQQSSTCGTCCSKREVTEGC